MPRGGTRKGAGKKPGTRWPSTIAKEQARELTRQMISASLAPMIQAQIANAMGIKYLVVREKKSGKFVRVSEGMARALQEGEELIEVWEKEPSTPAFIDLANRAIDKPKEQPQEIKVTGTDQRIARLVAARKRVKDE